MSAEGTEALTQRGIELFSLSNRVALVTGGNGGPGRAMALVLRAAGATKTDRPQPLALQTRTTHRRPHS